MSDDKKQESSIWPTPQFCFRVKFGALEMTFAEVSGLETETQIIEYRDGNNPSFSPVKMLGLEKLGNVTMKHGLCAGGHSFWDWFSKSKMGQPSRSTVLVALIDEEGKSVTSWTLNEAFVTKITTTAMESDDGEVAIDELEVAFDLMQSPNA